MTDLSFLCRHLIEHLDGAYDPEAKPRLIPPLLLQGATPTDLCTEQSLAEMVRRVQADRRPVDNAMVRIYVNGVASAEHRSHFFAQPVLTHESFSSWLTRSVGAERFGVVINGLERWSDELARRTLELFGDVFAEWGTPACSLELTLFAGNYGYTPFGIHLDDPFTNTVHFHLGPGAKRMILFSPETFHRLNGPEKRSDDCGRLSPYGDCTLIQAGDAYLLPAHYYHVGLTDAYCVGLAVCLGRFPKSELQRRAVSAATKSRVAAIQRAAWANAGASPADPERDAQAAEDLERNYTASEISKCGLKFRSRLRRVRVHERSAVQLDPAWPIGRGDQADGAAVFARGHCVRASRALSDDVLRMLASKVSLEDLLRRFETSQEPLDLMRFLGDLDAAGVLLVESTGAEGG